MFLFVASENSNYRNPGYFDLTVSLARNIKGFKVTGRGFEKEVIPSLEKKYPILKDKIIPFYSGMKLSEIEEKEKIENILIFETKSLVFDISVKEKNAMILLSDHLKDDDERIRDWKTRGLNFKEINFVFYIFKHRCDLIKKIFTNSNNIYFPHWSTKKYDIKNKKIFDILLSGSSDPEYSWREKYRNILRGKIIFKNFIDNLKPVQMYNVPFSLFRKNGPEFNDLISSSLYCLCDGGVNGRIPGKIFESMLARSIVIMPDPGSHKEILGLKHGENIIFHNQNASENEIVDLINNIEKKYNIEKIRENAYNLVKNNHMTKNRVETIINNIRKQDA